ncbi:MAG: type IV pilin N-terminal domain-containing protein [Methanomicrobiales archaeon]|nr:type IV pilin N-terminal domain-containing protein [Methanomicrobiales archaeon]
MPPRRASPAISPVIGTVLLVGMTVILSALVYLLVLAAPPPGIDPSRFQYIRIVAVRQAGDPFTPTCDDSCLILLHEGNAPLGNDGISAVVLRNDETLIANVTTLNGKRFISTKHFGVEHLGGPGSRGSAWDPGEEIWIDLREHAVAEGDLVTVRIIDRDSDLVLSEDTARV